MKRDQKTGVSNRRNERGSVLAYTVLSVLFLFLAVGLGVDLSHMYLVKTELQNTADAAALAGASALTLPSNKKPIKTAVDRAVMIMDANKYNFNKKDYTAIMSASAQRNLVRFAVNLGDFDSGKDMSEADAAKKNNIRFVRVTTPSVPVNIFFSVPILSSAVNLDARATSGLSIPGNINICISPLAAVSCPDNDLACNLCDPKDGSDCDNSKYWGVCPGADPHGEQSYTDEVTGITTKCDPKRQFCKGCKYTIRAGPQGGGGPSAGNFQILGCAGNGGDAVRDSLAAYGTNCTCGNVSPGNTVATQTGVEAGPVRAGLNTRFDVYGPGLSYSSSTPPDSNIQQGTAIDSTKGVYSGITYQQYSEPGTGDPPPIDPSLTSGHPGVALRRVLLLPIIGVNQFSNGNSTVTVGSLGVFFMQRQVDETGTGGDIQVEYVDNNVSDVVGYDPNGGTTTNIVTPVLYR